MEIREHLEAIKAAQTEYDQAWVTFRQQYESGDVNPTTALAALDRAEKILKKAKIAFAEAMFVQRALLSNADAYHNFINQVWVAVTGEAPDTWEYPAQVLRALEELLGKNPPNRLVGASQQP